MTAATFRTFSDPEAFFAALRARESTASLRDRGSFRPM